MTVLFILISGLFGIISLSAIFHLRWARRLPPLSQLPDDTATEQIRCSIVLPARNEASRIETTVRRLLSQVGVNVQLVAVNDRSTDETGAILLRLAAEDPRIRVVQIENLPAGWIGKCHACHNGAALVDGDWILFTDADCWLRSDVIARALRTAHRERVDHVTLTPGFSLNSISVRAWYLFFLISLLDWIAGVNRNRRRAHLGLGAFNLVRATAYRECGGYEALRLTVLDDIKLGWLLARAGKATRAFLGAHDVECHWGTTLRQMVQVMEKNYFAVLNFRTWLAAAMGAMGVLLLSTLVLGLISGTPAGLAAVLSPFLLSVPGAMLARRVGWPWSCALGVPFMMPVFLYAMANSTIVTLRQGGVRWRDTFYSIEALRAACAEMTTRHMKTRSSGKPHPTQPRGHT